MLVLRKSIGIEVLAGEPRPGEQAVYVRLRHPKLPRGGIMFALPYGNGRTLARMITAVVDGEGVIDSAATIVDGEDVEVDD